MAGRWQRKLLVLYAEDDEAFARGYLAPALGLGASAAAGEGEGAEGLAISGAELARRPVAELARLVASSELVIPVVSPAFLADPWLRLSEGLASHAAIAGEAGEAGEAPEAGAASSAGPGVVLLKLRACEVPLYQAMQVALDYTDEDAWEAETARLRQHASRPAEPREEAGAPSCPYPGMQPYRAQEAAFFHGRQGEIGEVLARLDAGARELYVIGPSGSGKSSLVAAGVLPRLLARPGKRFTRTLRPGAAPQAALLEALGGAGGASSGDVEAALAARLLSDASAELVLVIDQAEELFSLASPEELRRFAASLRPLRAEPRCLLLFTLRADFYSELLLSALWAEGSRQHVDLAPMRGEALRAAIVEPARQVGVFLEPALVDRLLADADDQPGAQPLLQEALVQLWAQQRYRFISVAAYRAMGGLATALSRRADKVLAQLSEGQAQLARRTLLRLVAFGEGRPHTRRRLPMAALRGSEPAAELAAVLAALTSSRLIVTSAGRGAAETEDFADLCHDVLIIAWPAFAGWVEARRLDEQRRRQLQAQAELWRARGGASAGLLDEGELAAALSWRTTDAARELGEGAEVAAWIAASQRALDEERRRRRWRWGTSFAVLAGFAVLALILAARATASAREAARQEQEARSNAGRAEALLVAQYQDAGRRWIVEGKPQRAVPYLVAARQLDPHEGKEETAQQRVRRLLFRAASAASVRRSFQATARLTSLWLSEGDRVIVTSGEDGAVQRWSADTGAPLGPPLGHPASVRVNDLSADGARLVTVCADGLARLWELGGASPVGRALAHPGRVRAARITRDGAMVITAGEDGTLRRWEASTGEGLGAPLVEGRGISQIELSPDGAHLAVLDGTTAVVSLWSLGAAPRRLELRSATIGSSAAMVAFSADGSRLAVVQEPYVVAQLYDTATGASLGGPNLTEVVRRVAPLPASPKGFLAMGAFSVVWTEPGAADRALSSMVQQSGLIADDAGTAFLLWTAQGDFELRRMRDGRLLARVEGEIAAERARLGRGGHLLVTATEQGTVKIWNLTYEEEPAAEERPPPPPLAVGRWVWPLGVDKRVARFSTDGRWAAVAVGARPAHVRLWDTQRRQVLAELAHDREVTGARFMGARLATYGADGLLRLWEASSGRSLYVLKHRDWVNDVELAADGETFLSLADGEVRLWETESGNQLLPEITHHLDEGAQAKDGARLAAAPAGEVAERKWKRARIAKAWFSRDGKKIITRGVDGTLRSTDLSRDEGTLEEWRRVAELGLFSSMMNSNR